MKNKLQEIFSKFDTGTSFYKAKLHGSGHINDTYLVEVKENPGTKFILQKINNLVFRNIPELQKNIFRVTEHLKLKLKSSNQRTNLKKGLSLILTKDGCTFHKDKFDDYWRLYTFISGTCSYDKAPGKDICYQGGLAYGEFLGFLTDLKGSPLNETIPDFHNIVHRLNNYKNALAENYKNRKELAIEEIDFAAKRFQTITRIHELREKGILLSRVTHNDTKINNVLFDKKTGSCVCVIDLDTVMNGVAHFDFGDAIRTIANSGAEDERNLDKVYVNKQFFKAFAKGFLNSASLFLKKVEIAELTEGARYMCFIIGLRFLTDFLSGDTYFKTSYPLHNLYRTKVQFKLVQEIESQCNEFEDFIFQQYEQILNKKKSTPR